MLSIQRSTLPQALTVLRTSVVAAAALVVATSVLQTRAIGQTDEPTPAPRELRMDQLERALRDRTNGFESCAVTWTTKHRMSQLLAMQSSGQLEALTKMSADEVQKLKARPMLSYEDTTTLVFSSGDKMHVERHGQRPAGPDLSMQEFRVVDASDGAVSFSTESKHSLRPYPYTYIYNFALCDASATRETLPIRACLLPFYGPEHRELNLASLSPVETDDELLRHVTDPDAECFKRARDDGAIAVLFAFDPRREHNLTKQVIVGEGGRMRLSLEIDYVKDMRHARWRPSKWLFTCFDVDGEINWLSESTVETFELDPVIDDGMFGLELIPGALVSDYRTSAEGYDPDLERAFYLVTEGGGKRLVERSERSASYDDLVRTAAQRNPATQAAPKDDDLP